MGICITGQVRWAIDRLPVMKIQGLEKKHGLAISEINTIIEAELVRLQKVCPAELRKKV